MTSPSVSSELYGPVRDDVGKVDDLITALRPKDFPFLSNILDHVLEAGGKRVRPAMALLAGKLGATTSTCWCRWRRRSSCCTRRRWCTTT